MLQLFVIAITCSVAHGMTYTACTSGGKYLESAFACEDISPAAVCTKFYFKANMAKAGDTGERHPNCYTDGTAASPTANKEILQAALDSCPKTCGLCCMSAKFDCEDDKNFGCAKMAALPKRKLGPGFPIGREMSENVWAVRPEKPRMRRYTGWLREISVQR
ncbi:unnamed protein product [Cylicocyclus nassatus]|uniref:ShKT domain-containing protein n=1 Tax=Cylicocyclus nassatus TaxID=53992 RepID=A0AA36MB85_CYLNA|nr:unnamed protein product [Cylicocyclus nassatus]